MTETETAPVLTRDAALPAGGGPRHARVTRRPWLVTAGVALVYLALSAVANGNTSTHGVAHTLQPSGGNDVAEEIWFLAQTPWVLLHGHNPFVNDWLDKGRRQLDGQHDDAPARHPGLPRHVLLRSNRHVQRADQISRSSHRR